MSHRQERELFMQAQRYSSRSGAVLSLLGSVLVIYGVFFLPMVFGNGGNSAESINMPASEWTVINVSLQSFSQLSPVAVLLALPMLSMLFVLGTSAAGFFRELSPKIIAWRRSAAIAGLIIQGPVGFGMAFLYSFGFNLGAGFWLVLLTRSDSKEQRRTLRCPLIHAQGTRKS